MSPTDSSSTQAPATEDTLDALKHEIVLLDLPLHHSEFVMPNVCCSCSKYASGWHRLSKGLQSKSTGFFDAWIARQSLGWWNEGEDEEPLKALKFPLCDECFKPFEWDRVVGIGGLLAAAILGLSVGFELVILTLVILVVAGQMIMKILGLFPRSQPDGAPSLLQRQAVSGQVQVTRKRSTMALYFSNGLFAYHFCRVNAIRGLQIVQGTGVAEAIERYWQEKESETGRQRSESPDPSTGASSKRPISQSQPTGRSKRRPKASALPETSVESESPSPSHGEWQPVDLLWRIGLITSILILFVALVFHGFVSDGFEPSRDSATLFILGILFELIVWVGPFLAIPLLIISLIYARATTSATQLDKPAETYDDWRRIKPED